MSGLIGARVPRLEDHALLTGKARFVDDIASPGVLAAAFVRSPHPHALIRGVDASAARAVPGVVAVLMLEDLAPVMKRRRMMRTSNSGTRLDQSWCFALADGEVSFVGEPVAIVLDFLGIALAELGSISERRVYKLLEGGEGLPPFLSEHAGTCSGFMLARPADFIFNRMRRQPDDLGCVRGGRGLR